MIKYKVGDRIIVRDKFETNMPDKNIFIGVTGTIKKCYGGEYPYGIKFDRQIYNSVGHNITYDFSWSSEQIIPYKYYKRIN
jgi:hypothetical protein